MAKHLKEKKKKNNVILNLIRLILVGLMLYSAYKIYLWWKENNSNNDIMNEISKIVQTTPKVDENSKNEINFNALKSENPDTVGWIKVNNTNVEYPVVKTADNSYYLTHNFKKENNAAGWIYVDYRNKLDGTDKNIIIYGHNRRNGSMFSTLKETLQSKWYENKENLNILFATENEPNCIYKIFSIYQIPNEDYYLQTTFKENEYKSFLEKIKSRSIKNFNEQVTENNQILTLSTCANNNDYRVVIHAKKQ